LLPFAPSFSQFIKEHLIVLAAMPNKMVLADLPTEIVTDVTHLFRTPNLLIFRLVYKQFRDQSCIVVLATFLPFIELIHAQLFSND